MASSKYTLRQYRTALKAYQKKISEYVGYEGRTYSNKYYEKQHEIDLFENMIKNRTYTNQDLAKMMRIVKPKDKTWVTDYVVQYSAEKDKFVSPVTQPVYKKREGVVVPSIGEVIHEVRKQTKPKKPSKPEDDTGEYGDFYSAWFDSLYYYVSKRVPFAPAEDLLASLDAVESMRMRDLYDELEGFARERGLDISDLDSEQMTQLSNYADKIVMDAVYRMEHEEDFEDLDDMMIGNSEF